MVRYILVSICSGLLFAFMDGVIHANPLAKKLLEVYRPIAKTSIHIPAGIAIDTMYGFVMCGIYILLYPALPSGSPVINGVIYGLIIGFFRVVMSVFSTFMTQNIPLITLVYILLTGLAEMLLIGIFYGLTIRPAALA